MKRSTKFTTMMVLTVGLLVSLLTFVVVVGVAKGRVSAADAAAETSSTGEISVIGETEYAEGVVDITLGDTIAVSGEGAEIDGTTVRITAAGVYHVSGTLADGQIEVDAKGKVYLELDGVSITSSSGPALLVTDAKKVSLTLVAGTTNFLVDADCGSEDDAALFTNDTLVINGDGTLVVTGNNNEGISSDDDLIINSGTIRVTAVDDGLNAHDDITITDGDVLIVAGGDGLDSNGTVHLIGGTVVLYGGTASGDGGIDAKGALTITGGTVVATGESVASPDDDSSQCSLCVTTGSLWPAGTIITVKRDGEQILSFTPENGYKSLLISSSKLTNGATYQVGVGESDTVYELDASR